MRNRDVGTNAEPRPVSSSGRPATWTVTETNVRTDESADTEPFASPGHRSGMDWVWIRAWFARWVRPWFLPAWFAVHATAMLVNLVLSPGSVGFDARLYHLAAQAWLSGGNPWEATLYWSSEHPAIAFAGPPPTLLPFVVLGWLPTDIVVLAVALAAGACALWILRRLRLPLWWMLFPPIIQGIWVGNLNIFVVALLVAGTTVPEAIAATFKVYAALPLVLRFRWRALTTAGLIAVATVPFLPWSEFIEHYSGITAALVDQAWGGQPPVVWAPLAMIGAAIALVLLGRERAAWLAVPVLWPATQLHYSVIALPALSPLLAAAAAVHQPGVLGLAVMALALYERWPAVRHGRRGAQRQPGTLPRATEPYGDLER